LRVGELLFGKEAGRLWYANLESHCRQLVPGTVRVELSISPEGKLVETSVLSNTSNELAAQLGQGVLRGNRG